jgi:hypothetical protein
LYLDFELTLPGALGKVGGIDQPPLEPPQARGEDHGQADADAERVL